MVKTASGGRDRTCGPVVNSHLDTRAVPGVTGIHGPGMDHAEPFARAVLLGAADGVMRVSDSQSLARAALEAVKDDSRVRLVRLADEVLAGGDFAGPAAIELAGLVRRLRQAQEQGQEGQKMPAGGQAHPEAPPALPGPRFGATPMSPV